MFNIHYKKYAKGYLVVYSKTTASGIMKIEGKGLHEIFLIIFTIFAEKMKYWGEIVKT